MKILIIGGGIAGLTLAAFLKDSNIEYDIVEKSRDWKHQGYAIGLWNNARHILGKLDLSSTFDKTSTPIHTYYIRDGQGKMIRKYNLRDFYINYGLGMSLVKRANLHDWLFSKIDPLKVKMGTTITSISQGNGKTSVSFDNGESRDYDLVVGADGVHSKVRNLIFKKDSTTLSKWRIWYMWVDNKFNTKASVTEYLEPGEFVSLFDSGDKTLAVITALSNNLIWDDPKGRIERLKKLFKDEVAVIPQLFDTLKDEDIIPSDLIHVRLKTWIKGRVVLLGDAAHGFEPYAGVGGSMALEDGYVLASELMRVSEGYSIDAALKAYEVKRKQRVNRAWILTQKMKAYSIISSRIVRKIVNLIIPYFPERFFIKDYSVLLNEEI